jgi:CBS domain-containing protein
MNTKNKIPTAEEIYNNYTRNYSIDEDITKPEIIELMIEFAKLHVKQALIEASNKGIALYTGDRKLPIIDKDSILNSYPEENIK